jgi:hypothetical protein
MQTSQWIGIGLLLLVFAFVTFAFRQGMKTKSEGNTSGDGGFSTWWYRGGRYPVLNEEPVPHP